MASRQGREDERDAIIEELELLYDEMQLAYNRVARMLSLRCTDCDDNCCDSIFHHHTYLEWYYLWQGLQTLSSNELKRIKEASRAYITSMRKIEEGIVEESESPMCPLNRDGRCILYRYRLLVCRTHGVPATFIRPDGKQISFPGCHHCQRITAHMHEYPQVERTRFYQQMADLERRFLALFPTEQPRLDICRAEMIIKEPPQIV